MKTEIRAIAHLGSDDHLAPILAHWTETERHMWAADDHRYSIDIHHILLRRAKGSLSVVVEIPRTKV